MEMSQDHVVVASHVLCCSPYASCPWAVSCSSGRVVCVSVDLDGTAPGGKPIDNSLSCAPLAVLQRSPSAADGHERALSGKRKAKVRVGVVRSEVRTYTLWYGNCTVHHRNWVLHLCDVRFMCDLD